MAEVKTGSFVERTRDKVLAAWQDKSLVWMKPWDRSKADGTRPFNPTTGNCYHGINHMLLGLQGHDDPRWMTLKQANAFGARIRPGEHGSLIIYWTSEKVVKNKETGEKEKIRLDRPKSFYSLVFNAEQIAGLPAYQKPELTWDPDARAETLLAASNARIEHRHGDRAFYSPASDKIVLPAREQFKDQSHYWATALHELGHWTGHPSRLNRDLSGGFQSASYAHEELIAEISAFSTCAELGLSTPGVDENHVAYIASWIKALKDDPYEIFRAAAAAEKVHAMVMSYDLDLFKTEQQEARKLTPKEPQAEPQATRRREHIQEPQAAMGAGR